jgi:hypothetical protein
LITHEHVLGPPDHHAWTSSDDPETLIAAFTGLYVSK